MGIRIHKVIGYGIKFEKPNFDSRLSINLKNYDEIYERLDSFTLADLIVYMKLNIDDDTYQRLDLRAIISIKEADTLKFNDIFSFICNPYEQLGMVMIPPGFEDWKRYDDTIDYYEASFREDLTEDKIILKNDPIYPYMRYMNARTGKIVYDNFGKIVHGDFTRNKVYDEINYAKLLGFDDVKDFEENFVPDIPWSVRAAYELLGIFKDNRMINQVRPLLAEWWC